MFRCIARPAKALVQQHTTAAAAINCQQKRHEIIMRRMYPPRLYKKGIPRALKRREYVYIMEENTVQKPQGDMEVILTIDIEELGCRGDVVAVSKSIARNHLLPVGAAVYATPENIEVGKQWLEEEPDKIRRTKAVAKTLNQLQSMTLPIPMNPDNPWTLNKKHVRVALRRCGVEVQDNCITLPKRDITEPEEFEFTLTVNKVDKVKIQAVIQHYHRDQEPESIPIFKKTKRKLTHIIAEAVDINKLAVQNQAL